MSIPELDKSFGINIISNKGSDNGGKATNAYLKAITGVDAVGATQKNDINQGKQKQKRERYEQV